jgi:hypothetical protein
MTLLNQSAVDLAFPIGSDSIELRWPAQRDRPADLSVWRIGDGPRDERRDAFRRLYYAVQPLPAESVIAFWPGWARNWADLAFSPKAAP